MTERVSRKLHQRNQYVVNCIGKEELVRLLSMANVLHSENPLKIENEWIDEYCLNEGNFDILNIKTDLDVHIPSETQMGKVYMRLITDTMLPEEDYAEAILRVYNKLIKFRPCGVKGHLSRAPEPSRMEMVDLMRIAGLLGYQDIVIT